jgi:high-affinity iron transporter
MFATAVIVFREVFEAGLAIGIVAAALGHAPLALRYIWGGVLAGILGSMVAALFAGGIANFFGGFGNEILTASILIIAVLMLAWHTLWMATHGRQMAQDLKAIGLQAASGNKPMLAVATVVALTVLREGGEVILFLYGAVAGSGATVLNSFFGGLMGIALGGAVSYVTFKGLVRIPMRWVFSITTGLIALLASGMAAQAAHFLQAAGATNLLVNEVWDWSNVLPDKGLPGTFLKALMGYSDRPTGLMLLAFVATLILFTLANHLAKPKPKPKAA